MEVEEFDLTPAPMFNPDVEALGTPERAAALHDAIVNADAVVIASPEYNGSMSAAIKNALEWASRPPTALDNKVFFVMGTGPGRTGGSRMYTQLSFALEAEGAWVIPRPRVLLPNIGQIISPEGELIDESVGELLDQAMDMLLETARRLGGVD